MNALAGNAPEDSADKAEHTLQWWKVDALWQWRQDITKLIERTQDLVMKSIGRPPKDYADNEQDLHNLIFEAVRVGAQHGGYHEAPKNGSNAWQRWMLTLCGGLALAGVIGGIAMFGQLSAIQANQANQSDKIQDLRSELSELRQSLRRP